MRWVIVLAIACSDPREPLAPPPVATARDAGAVPKDAGALYVGVITASETVEISSRFTGVVKSISVGIGDTVVANQVVAVMDATEQQDELRAANAAAGAAESAVRAARVEVTAALRKVDTEQQSFDKGISSRQELEDAKDNASRARAALETVASGAAAAAARAKAARDLVASAELRTPFAGKVAARVAGVGGRIEAGAPLLRIVAGDKLRVRFAVPPETKVALDTRITVDVGIGTRRERVVAVIRYRAPTIDIASQLLFAEAELVDDNAEIQPGLPAWVHPF